MTTEQMNKLRDLCGSMGLRAVSKLVLEFEVGEPPRYYAVGYSLDQQMDPLVKLVSDVSVSSRGDVTFEPLTFTHAARLLAEAVRAGNVDAARLLADEIMEHCGATPSSP